MDALVLPTGTVHTQIPDDFKKALLADKRAYDLWINITPLARNEWICWVMSGKQQSTRDRHVKVGISKLTSGMRRPCCWSGCPHRERNGH